MDVKINPIEEICPPMLALAGNASAQKAVFALAGGSDGDVLNVPDAAFIGGGDAPGTRTGLAAFEEISNVSIMAIPGITSAAVQLALVAHCQNLASRFAVLDMPCDMVKPQELLKHRAIIDSDYAAMYHPWLQVYDMAAKKAAYIPPSGAVCGIYARSDNTRGVHKAPANEVVNNAMGLSCLYNKGEQDLLKSGGRQPHPRAARPGHPRLGRPHLLLQQPVEIRQRPAALHLPRGDNQGPDQLGGLRAQRRSALAACAADDRLLPARHVPFGRAGGRHRGRGLLCQHRPRHHDPVGHPQRPPHLRHRRRAQPPG